MTSQEQPGPRSLHQGQPILHMGEPLTTARAAMILAHGRGASAEDILTLVPEIDQSGFAYLAPQAANAAWYPNRFIAPVASNEPWLSSALQVIDTLVNHVVEAGIPIERIMLLGFSQGGCLATEYAARFPRRYGGVIALSGALIENGDQPRVYSGSLADVPVFLGCSDVDFHIPKERVLRSAEILRGMGALVTTRLYPGMGHTINQDEINVIRQLMGVLLKDDL